MDCGSEAGFCFFLPVEDPRFFIFEFLVSLALAPASRNALKRIRASASGSVRANLADPVAFVSLCF